MLKLCQNLMITFLLLIANQSLGMLRLFRAPASMVNSLASRKVGLMAAGLGFYAEAEKKGGHFKIESSDGKYIAQPGKGDSVEVYDAQNETLVSRLSGHGCDAYPALIDKNNKYIVTVAKNGLIRVWHLKSGELVSVLEASDTENWTTIYLGYGGIAAICNQPRTTREQHWNISTGKRTYYSFA